MTAQREVEALETSGRYCARSTDRRIGHMISSGADEDTDNGMFDFSGLIAPSVLASQS